MQKITRVERRSEIVMFTDAGDDEVSTESAYWDFDDELDWGVLAEDDPGRLEVHHKNGNNFLFADQHIEFRKVLSENVPRRGVPRVPWQWIPLDDMQAPSSGNP